jgi:hypothetical protein
MFARGGPGRCRGGIAPSVCSFLGCENALPLPIAPIRQVPASRGYGGGVVPIYSIPPAGSRKKLPPRGELSVMPSGPLVPRLWRGSRGRGQVRPVRLVPIVPKSRPCRSRALSGGRAGRPSRAGRRMPHGVGPRGRRRTPTGRWSTCASASSGVPQVPWGRNRMSRCFRGLMVHPAQSPTLPQGRGCCNGVETGDESFFAEWHQGGSDPCRRLRSPCGRDRLDGAAVHRGSAGMGLCGDFRGTPPTGTSPGGAAACRVAGPGACRGRTGCAGEAGHGAHAGCRSPWLRAVGGGSPL